MEQGGKHQHLSPPELSNGNSQHLQPELSKSPEFSKFPSPLSPPPRWPARQFRRCVSRSPVTPEVRQAILSSFDFEKSYDEQPESAILKLEKLLGYERWPWLDDLDRRNTICDKVSMILHKFLWSHRYYWLTDTGIDGKSRLLISPKEGIEPLPLPEWLSTPYIVRVPHQDFTYKPETGEEICENPTITSGHAILDSDQRRVGTFSCLMNTTKSPQNHQLTWLCPTAGHVIDDLASELFVQPYDTSGEMSLRVATTSVRTSGRPQHSIDEEPSFRDDCAFLLVKEEDLHAFQRVLWNLNPFCVKRRLRGGVDILDPLSISRYADLKKRIRTNRVIVCKYGSSTDLTVGCLVELTRRPPLGWYGDEDDNDLQMDMDVNEWMGLVKWIGLPFSAPGDSGSLVFTMVDGIMAPLGIHVGAPENTNSSYFISIETFCFAAEAEGWEPRFASC